MERLFPNVIGITHFRPGNRDCEPIFFCCPVAISFKENRREPGSFNTARKVIRSAAARKPPPAKRGAGDQFLEVKVALPELSTL